MARISAIVVGIVASVAWVAGWCLDPAKEATLVVALVCGTASAFFQLSTRDFLSRIQVLVDRAIDRASEDGGEFLDQTRETRERVSALARTQLIFAALAPAFATARSLYDLRIFTACAFAAAAAAIALALMLDGASRQFTRLLEAEKLARNDQEKLKVYAKERKDPVSAEALTKQNPNLARYTSRSVQAEAKH